MSHKPAKRSLTDLIKMKEQGAPAAWVTAYDLLPVTTLEEKKMLVAEALEDGGILAFDHDAEMAACRLGEEEGRPVFREAVAI